MNKFIYSKSTFFSVCTTTTTGRGLHHRRAHKAWYDKRLIQQATLPGLRHWTREETALLARQEAELTIQGVVVHQPDSVSVLPTAVRRLHQQLLPLPGIRSLGGKLPHHLATVTSPSQEQSSSQRNPKPSFLEIFDQSSFPLFSPDFYFAQRIDRLIQLDERQRAFRGGIDGCRRHSSESIHQFPLTVHRHARHRQGL